MCVCARQVSVCQVFKEVTLELVVDEAFHSRLLQEVATSVQERDYRQSCSSRQQRLPQWHMSTRRRTLTWVDTFVVFEGLQGRLAWICDIKAGFVTEILEVFCQISAMILMMTRVLVFAQSDELQLQTQTETNRRLSPLPLSGRISRRHFSSFSCL